MSFDLLTRPWIAVAYVDGTVTDVSPVTLFANAGQIESNCGRWPRRIT